MADLEPLLRFWRALDSRFERVVPAWWGAVVTDSRFPIIWDVNYARVEARDPGLTLAEVESVLLPEAGPAGAHHVHLVLFHPEDSTGLLAEASTRGDRLSWELVMELRGESLDPPARVDVEEVREFDETFWKRLRESLREFEITDREAVRQLIEIERDLMLPAGKRWFAIRERGRAMAFGALVALEGVGYVDHVVTFPKARRRGYASAIVHRIGEESRAAGLEHLYLLAEADGGARSLYERLGFSHVTQIASTLRPLG